MDSNVESNQTISLDAPEQYYCVQNQVPKQKTHSFQVLNLLAANSYEELRRLKIKKNTEMLHKLGLAEGPPAKRQKTGPEKTPAENHHLGN